MATTINNMKINDIMREVTFNSHKDISKQYVYNCDNCSLSILTASHADSSVNNTIEVAIKTKDFSQFMYVNPFKEEITEEDWYFEYAILHEFPIYGLPLLLLQFSHCSEEYLNDLWKGFYLIEGVY